MSTKKRTKILVEAIQESNLQVAIQIQQVRILVEEMVGAESLALAVSKVEMVETVETVEMVEMVEMVLRQEAVKDLRPEMVNRPELVAKGLLLRT